MSIRKIGTLSMAATFCGCFLGAGYVSGQELWQYFGCYGNTGLLSLILSISLIGLSTLLVLWLSDHAGTGTVDRLILRFESSKLRSFVGTLYSLLYFVIIIIMTSGVSSLLYQIFGLPKIIGSALAVLLIMITVYFGFNGMVCIFNLVIPFLVAAAVLISVFCIKEKGISNLSLPVSDTNPMLGPWYSSALNYMALNMFGAIGIIAPLVSHCKSKRSGRLGVLIGCLMLMAIAVLILLAMSADSGSVSVDLPMLYMSQKLGPLSAGIYSVLLFLAMYGNANAMMVASLNYFEKRLPNGKETKGRILRILLVGIIVFLCSLTGFSTLVAKIYPIVGYVGFLAVLLMAEHALHLARKEARKGKEKS